MKARTRLSPAAHEKLRGCILMALAPLERPLRLAKIAEYARVALGKDELARAWDFLQTVSDELQLLKNDGAIHLVTGPGGGWRRS
jgi:hypothetical protein